MLDDIVKRLRYCSEETSGCGLCALSDSCILRVGLLQQAANIIAELDRENKSLAKSVNEASEILRKRWLPVTETPPLKVGDKGYNGYLVYANGYYEIADYTTDKLDNIPYFYVDGEYEPNVRYFMPLPPRPNED